MVRRRCDNSESSHWRNSIMLSSLHDLKDTFDGLTALVWDGFVIVVMLLLLFVDFERLPWLIVRVPPMLFNFCLWVPTALVFPELKSRSWHVIAISITQLKRKISKSDFNLPAYHRRSPVDRNAENRTMLCRNNCYFSIHLSLTWPKRQRTVEHAILYNRFYSIV